MRTALLVFKYAAIAFCAVLWNVQLFYTANSVVKVEDRLPMWYCYVTGYLIQIVIATYFIKEIESKKS